MYNQQEEDFDTVLENIYSKAIEDGQDEEEIEEDETDDNMFLDMMEVYLQGEVEKEDDNNEGDYDYDDYDGDINDAENG